MVATPVKRSVMSPRSNCTRSSSPRSRPRSPVKKTPRMDASADSDSPKQIPLEPATAEPVPSREGTPESIEECKEGERSPETNFPEARDTSTQALAPKMTIQPIPKWEQPQIPGGMWSPPALS